VAPKQEIRGAIDDAVALPSGDGWLITGWTSRTWAESEPPERVFANLTLGDVTGETATAFYPRLDVPDGAAGFCTVLAAACPERAEFVGLQLPHLRLRISIPPQRERRLSAEALATACRRTVRGAGLHAHPVLDRLPRPAFKGADTVAELWPPVQIEFDQAIRVPPDGLALVGWCFDPAGAVESLRVRAGAASALLDPTHLLTIRRPDLVQSLGKRYGLEDDRIGFLAYAPGVAGSAARPHLEVETREGAIGLKSIRVLDLAGLGAIKQILSVPRPARARLQTAFDNVLGPIVAGLNAARLSRPRPFDELVFGPQNPAPRASVIVTIYGRLDLTEYQLALLSERPDPSAEIVLVLDDPALHDDAERLFASCWARLRLPFRALLLAENLGYAPANNVGLSVARGRYVCLLNSDVFPTAGIGSAWLAPLVAQLEADPTLGAIGPLLLYEDGTVQHRGMHFEQLADFGRWTFPMHTGKGEPAPSGAEHLDVAALTGACVVLRRDELQRLGGLDERYLIGDFEDADLCRRLRVAGRRCRVDTGQRLYHLERQSQAEAQPWRGNLTLFNAWQHASRWGTELAAAA